MFNNQSAYNVAFICYGIYNTTQLSNFMSIPENTLIALFKKSGKIKADELNNAKNVATHLGCSISDVLLGRGLLTEDEYGQSLSKYFNIPYVDLKKKEIGFEILNLIPEDFATEKNVIAFDKRDNDIFIAVEDPKDLELIETVKKMIGARHVRVSLSTAQAIRDAIKTYKISGKALSDETLKEDPEESAVSLINKLLDKAVREDVSDIHIEPLEDKMLVRFRVDGVMHDEGAYHKSLHASAVARVKILSDLKLDETRLPQDGQFEFKTKSGDKVSLRVSTSPTVYGEKTVLRVLKSTIAHFNLEELGFLPEDLEMITRSIEKTHGMFLVTGPTGSGKTTTLYTVLGLLNKSDVNIITIEDPVENKINRVNQIQINPTINLTFASGLRSLLRQDPDIIMVGEIRDHETSIIAVNAAMTGHLVFSSVHANTAAGVIPRMIDLGTEPFLLASTLNMVVAQRLVRVLCQKCKKQVPLDKTVKARLSDLKSEINPITLKKLTTNFIPQGCPTCFNTGFKGRIGIFEILPIDENIKELMVEKASAQKISTEAKKRGLKTMLEDGIIKVSKGQTSLQEVFRVVSQ
jgi:type IV pilus assembly protein PilB